MATNYDANAQYSAPQGAPPQQSGYYQQNQYGAPPQQNGYAQQDYSQAPPTYGQTYGVQPGYGQDGKNDFNHAFKIEKPKWNDLWAAILFLAVFAGFTAVSGITLAGYTGWKGTFGSGIYNNVSGFGLNTNTIVLFAFVLVVALVLSFIYVNLARLFPKAFIWITGILHIIFGFATAIYMLYRKYYSGGIVFLIFAVLNLVFFISWIPRIPFSALLLKTTIDVSKKYGHVYMVSFIGGIIATAFAAWYSVTLVAIYARFEPGNASTGTNPACSGTYGCSSAKVIGLVVFITFSMYWISEVIKNVIHTTISGLYGSWYFCPNNMPKGATRGAFKRATTTSFGSICFGSLIVAIISALRQLCSVAQNTQGAQGNMVGAIFLCILGCLISILNWAVQFLNRYAFSYIALYGEAYIPAAKQTWKFIKDRGIDALINECLIGPVLSSGATFVAYACALLAYLYVDFTNPSYNTNNQFTPVVVAFSFLIGLQICNIFTTPIASGMDTIFVATAFDPQVLMREHPELYAEMVRLYPHVQEAIHA